MYCGVILVVIKSLFSMILIALSLLSVQVYAVNLPSYSYTQVYAYDNQDSCVDVDDQDSSSSLISDPFIVINKNIFNINSLLDRAFLSPIAKMYLKIPGRGRSYVNNFMNNISEPINTINLIFQGEFKQAQVSFARLMTNTLLGALGIMDVASSLNLKRTNEDFGQTMAYRGVPSGPYIVAPLIGPTSARDLTGKVADFFMDPFRYILTRKEYDVIEAVWVVHKRADLDGALEIINNSLDPYETAKLMYIQNRNSQIKNKHNNFQ